MDAALSKRSTRPAARLLALAAVCILGVAAIVRQGHNVQIALDADDTRELETLAISAVARQAENGPSALYGPFSAANPIVLIHAPLYYRIAAGGCWMLTRAGIEPMEAAIAAGRGVSFLAWLATLAVAGAIGRLGGGTKRAAILSIVLIAGSPLFAGYNVTVRNDTLSLLFQTLGAWLVLTRLATTGPSASGADRDWLVGIAFISFGLSCCVRQANLVVPAICLLLLAAHSWRGFISFRKLALAPVISIAVIIAYYAAEQWLTSGMMGRAVFAMPSKISRLNHAGWRHVGAVFFELAKLCAGPIALAIVSAGPRRADGRWLDRALWLLVLAEMLSMIPLCLNSTGAWVNYGLQAFVFASILIGRQLDRAFDAHAPLPREIAIGFAAVFLACVTARNVAISANARTAERANLNQLLADPVVPTNAAELYFVHRPQYNRQFGQPRLAVDDWLYDAFERVRAAEPRSRWLGEELVAGQVRCVIEPRGGVIAEGVVPGLRERLPELGYVPAKTVGRYNVWVRRGPIAEHFLPVRD